MTRAGNLNKTSVRKSLKVFICQRAESFRVVFDISLLLNVRRLSVVLDSLIGADIV